MGLTESEREELSRLESRFEGFDGYRISDNSVFGQRFDPDLVEEDKRNSYPGEFDETVPGMRFTHLGTLNDFEKYQELKARDNSI